MKSMLIAACLIMFAVVQTSSVMAKELKEFQIEADEFYKQGNYKKAYKGYLKVAKVGDIYSQYWVAHMYANGEGRKVDIDKAFAWSALAAEGGNEKLVSYSDSLFELTTDKAAAEKVAKKLNKKYGKQALKKKAEAIASRDTGRRQGSCVGSRLTCYKGAAYDPLLSYIPIRMPDPAGAGGG